MKRLDSSEFDARRDECGQTTRDVLDFLRTAAEHAGSHIGPPTFETRGVGICVLDRREAVLPARPEAQSGPRLGSGAGRESRRARVRGDGVRT